MQKIEGHDKFSYSTFLKANKAFEEKKHDIAAKGYTECIENGQKTGFVFYDLANTYSLLNDYGKAILNYERAYKYIPRFAYLNINYDIALEKVKQRSIRPFLLHQYTYNEIYIAIVFLLMLSVFFIGSSMLRTKVQQICKLISVIVITCFFLLSLTFAKKLIIDSASAVILSNVTNIKDMPMEDAKTISPVYAGNIVVVLNSISNWYKIKKYDKIGWIRHSEAEYIDI